MAHRPGRTCGILSSSNGALPQSRRETMTATARQNYTAPVFAFATLVISFGWVMLRFA